MLRLLAGQPMLLEMLVHLWKEAVINKAFVLHGISDQKIIHVLVTQAIPGIIVDEVHGELASVLNTVMVLHKNNAQERSNAGRRFHHKMKFKLKSPNDFVTARNWYTILRTSFNACHRPVAMQVQQSQMNTMRFYFSR